MDVLIELMLRFLFSASGYTKQGTESEISTILTSIVFGFVFGVLIGSISFLFIQSTTLQESFFGFGCLIIIPLLTANCLTLLINYRVRQNGMQTEDPEWAFNRKLFVWSVASFVFGVLLIHVLGIKNA